MNVNDPLTRAHLIAAMQFLEGLFAHDQSAGYAIMLFDKDGMTEGTLAANVESDKVYELLRAVVQRWEKQRTN